MFLRLCTRLMAKKGKTTLTYLAGRYKLDGNRIIYLDQLSMYTDSQCNGAITLIGEFRRDDLASIIGAQCEQTSKYEIVRLTCVRSEIWYYPGSEICK